LPILLLARFLKLTKTRRLENGRTIGYHYFDKMKPIAILYQYTFLIDTMIAYYTKIRFEQWKGKIVICDRSPYDALIDLMISVQNDQLINNDVKNMFCRMAKNAIVILLIASPRTLQNRREDVSADKTIAQKVHLYKELFKIHSFHKVDAEKKIQTVRKEIQEIINPFL